MPNIPTPRSYQQVLGDSIDILLGKLGLKGLKVGGPILTYLETAAMGDVRSNQDIFTGLASADIDNAEGEALTSIGLMEGLTQRAATYASSKSGALTDTSFTKRSTQVYSGATAPIAGSTTVYVRDATGFSTPTGQLYLGRNTTNYEGPLSYTNCVKDGSGNFWTITLSTPTTKYHNHNESVVFAQGGNRTLSAGTGVQTAGSATETVNFTVLNDYVLPDGETSLDNIAFVAVNPGTTGNVPKNSVTGFANSPFNGATFTNSSALTNALATETEDEFRDRIKDAKNSRSKGTALAVKTAVYGVQAADETATVVSSSLVQRTDATDTLYIDDGTGYEEKQVGIPSENIITDVAGGAQDFQLTGGAPVAKASVETTETAPFNLEASLTLELLVNGVSSVHSFVASDFIDIAAATAYEIVSAINKDSTLLFGARTSSNGEKVVLYAKAETNDSIEVPVTTTAVNTANTYLGFPVGVVSTLNLYKNNQLLTKDGTTPTINSNTQSQWGACSTGATLTVKVEGIAATATVTDADFTALGYSGVSSTAPLSVWATVLNSKIAGVNVSVNSNYLTMESNLGPEARASLEITGGTLVTTSNMFETGVSQGASKDYVFNRNTGEIHLTEPLSAGDSLTAGSTYTRAYLDSTSFTTKTSGTSPVTLWWTFDSDASIVTTGASPSIPMAVSSTSDADGFTISLTASPIFIFTNVQVGDYLILWDPNWGTVPSTSLLWTSTIPAFVISYASPGVIKFKFSGSITSIPVFNMTTTGLTVVRSKTRPIVTSITASTTFSPTTLATLLNTTLNAYGARAYTPTPDVCRVETYEYGTTGQVGMVCVDTNGALMGFAPEIANNQIANTAFDTSDSVLGTPEFTWNTRETAGADDYIDLYENVALNGSTSDYRYTRGLAVQVKNPLTTLTTTPTAPAFGVYKPLDNYLNDALSLLDSGMNGYKYDRYIYLNRFALTNEDSLKLVYDGDSTTKIFDITLGYLCKPAVTGTAPGPYHDPYGISSIKVVNTDNSSLVNQFGSASNFFKGFKVLTKAQETLLWPADGATSSRSIQFRAKRWGPEGSYYGVRYVYPSAPNADVAVSATPGASGPNIDIQLPSGALRSGLVNGQKYAVEFSGTTATIYAGYKVNVTVLGGPIYRATLVASSGATITNVAVDDYLCVYSAGTTPNGLIKVTNLVSTTVFDFVYVSGAAAVAETNVRVIASDGTVPTTPVSFGSTVAGDIFYLAAGTGLQATLKSNPMSVNTFDSADGHWIKVWTNASVVNEGFRSIVTPGNLTIYPVDTSKTNTDTGTPNFATRINAATGNLWVEASTLNWYKLSVYNSSNLPVIKSTLDSYIIDTVGTGTYTQLVGGILYSSVSAVSSGHHNLVILGPGPSPLNWSSDHDWANERIYLVPTEPNSLQRYLGTSAVSGLGSNGDVTVTGIGEKLELTSSTLGSSGKIQIVHNSANGTAIPVITYPVTGTNQYLKVSASLGTGLGGLQWVALNNTEKIPLVKNWTTATKLAIANSSGDSIITRSVAGDAFAAYVSGGSAMSSKKWKIEKHGKFMCYVYLPSNSPTTPTFGTINEESQVVITGGADPANQGRFRIVRAIQSPNGTLQANRYAFWIENAAGVEEHSVTITTVEVFTGDSVLPGDTFVVNSAGLVNATNQGEWLVKSNNLGADSITVAGVMATQSATALGSVVGQISMMPSQPARMIKKVLGVAPDTDSTKLVVHLEGPLGAKYFTPAAGTYIENLDKLGFSAETQSGKDAYQVNTGLIAECNKVLYGDETNSTTYPGVLAKGDDLNISGPMVKRLTMSLGIRLTQGTESEVISAVQDAVAALINTNFVGKSISLSKIVRAAQNVPGVGSVVMLSPAMNSTTDTISVQSGEKTLCLDPKTDVLVSVLA